MYTRDTRSERPSFMAKIKPFLWLLVGYSLVTCGYLLRSNIAKD